MKIMSWNINGIRAWHKKGHLDWLKKQNFDVICFQETKATEDQVPDEIKNMEGYFAYFDSPKEKKGYSGTAIISREKPTKVEYEMGSTTLDKEGRLIATHFKKFVLVNVYFPNGGGGPERLKFKLDFYDKFLQYIEKLRVSGKKVIFCGDINTAHEEIDLARPKQNEKNTGFLPEERAWLDEVVNRGYIDVFRHFYPSKTSAYTYWDQKTFARERNVGWRIDYFFVSPDLLRKVKGIKILDKVTGSDHCPIVMELTM